MAQQQSFFHHRLHLTMIWQKHRPKQGVTNFQKNKNICVCLCVTRFRRPHRHQIAVKYGGKLVEWKLPKILQLLQIQIIICLIINFKKLRNFHKTFPLPNFLQHAAYMYVCTTKNHAYNLYSVYSTGSHVIKK